MSEHPAAAILSGVVVYCGAMPVKRASFSRQCRVDNDENYVWIAYQSGRRAVSGRGGRCIASLPSAERGRSDQATCPVPRRPMIGSAKERKPGYRQYDSLRSCSSNRFRRWMPATRLWLRASSMSPADGTGLARRFTALACAARTE